MSTAHALSDADLMRQPRDGYKRELVDGEIVVSPAGARHGAISIRLGALLHRHAERKKLGVVFDSSTGFRLPGGNVRSPDVSFVSRKRLPGGKPPMGFFEGAPDLAIEVLSPDDSKRLVLDKVGELLAAGARLVWVIDPATRSAAIHRSLTDVLRVGDRNFLDGEDVLPGFRCRLGPLLD